MAIKTKVTPQDRLVTVSSVDTTPDTLINKITSSTLAISKQNPAGNEQLKIEAPTGSDEKFLNAAFTTANGTIYLDATDWRGRIVQYMFVYQDPARVPAEDWDWSPAHLDVRYFRLGTNYDFQGGINPPGDFQFENIGFGSITVNIFCETLTGKIKAVVAGVGLPTAAFPCKLRLKASGVF